MGSKTSRILHFGVKCEKDVSFKIHACISRYPLDCVDHGAVLDFVWK